MNFSEALQLMQNGKEVKRSFWTESRMSINGGRLYITVDGEITTPSTIHSYYLFATDWEEVKTELVCPEENLNYDYHWLSYRKRVYLYCWSYQGWLEPIRDELMSPQLAFKDGWKYVGPVVPPTV